MFEISDDEMEIFRCLYRTKFIHENFLEVIQVGRESGFELVCGADKVRAIISYMCHIPREYKAYCVYDAGEDKTIN